MALRKAEGLRITPRAVSRELPAQDGAREPAQASRPPARLSLVDSDEQRLFARVAPVVNRLVWSMLGPDSEREDIAHEVFIRIFRARESLRNEDVLEAWAARVTVNTVKNELRRRRLRRWVLFDFWDDGSSLRSYVEDVQGRELLRAAFRALERLPADERVALSLRLFHEAEVDEIARLTECSPRTTKRRLSAAKRRFELFAQRDPLLSGWLRARTKEPHDG